VVSKNLELRSIAATCGAMLGCLAALACAAACGDDASAVDAGPRDAGKHADHADASPPAATIDAGPGCSGTALKPGDLPRNIGGTGRAGRAYDLHLPKGYDGSPMPLVINMHGLVSNAMQQPQVSAMTKVADDNGFIVAYPSGAGSLNSWNAGDCCEFADTTRDDVAFITAVIDDIASVVCVDPSRIYAAGFSNGGFMAQRLGCELSDRIAAIASVSSVLGIPPEDCKPTRPMPLMMLNGTSDPLVQYKGGQPTGWSLIFPGSTPPTFRSVDETATFWLKQNGCSEATERSFEKGDTICDTHKECDGGSEFTLCTIDGGGHAWPGGDNSPFGAALPLIQTFLGKVSTSMNGSQEIWDFFKRHPLP